MRPYSVLEPGPRARRRLDWPVIVVLVFAAWGFLVTVAILALALSHALAELLVG